MFKITSNKGFHITFENGLTVSTQFSQYNYCDNSRLENVKPECINAEVAIWNKEGKWVTKEFYNIDDDVIGYLTSNEVIEIMYKAKNYRKEC